MSQRVVIDYGPESARHYHEGYAIVTIDVIRATTTAITAVAMGRRCFPVPSIEAALPLAARLEKPVLVGELGGNMPYGFDINNSPAHMAARSDIERPMILLSSSGTRLIYESRAADATYLACFRNVRATAEAAARHSRVAIIGAGTRGEFREEDQLCCARIAAELARLGFAFEDDDTAKLVEDWAAAPNDAWLESRSVAYLRDSGQLADLDYVLEHIDDLDQAFVLKHDEVRSLPQGDALV